MTLITTSMALANLPSLECLLGRPVIYRYRSAKGGSGIVTWGKKPSAIKAERLARNSGLPLLRIEDGFLRSVGLGRDEPPLSIVLDDLGIYYDASAPSRLEVFVATSLLSFDEQNRAHHLISAWRAARISKYNHSREWMTSPFFEESFPRISSSPYVLVVDQTLNDASIQYGMADESSFHRMLDAALQENPDCLVLLKVHPEVMAGRKQGHYNLAALATNPRVVVLGEDVHPVSLIEGAQAVYVVTSQMGFEGLLWGKPVRTFGMPFYAGWGLTEDELPMPKRRRAVSLEVLVHAALVKYPRYIDPETGQRCEPERIIEWMGLQRKMRNRFPPLVYASGFSLYKRSIVRRFFQGSTVRFVKGIWNVPAGGTAVVWGRNGSSGLRSGHRASTAVIDGTDNGGTHCGNLVCLEDGFLRSVGLGADLVAPLSWVMDRQGLYYDATVPSDLEELLRTFVFDEVLRDRARRFQETIVRHGLTKYNVGIGKWVRPEERGRGSQFPHLDSRSEKDEQRRHRVASSDGRRVILVPGQVESDASIRFGSAGLRANLGLLQAVREKNPDAYVVYKPHPDVRAGLRKAGLGENEAAHWCDEVVGDVPMQAMLDAVDEVHVLTSLTGFEALLRGKKVVCYGNPFYAGWGLTTDMAPLARRNRMLTLDELVAGVLILYPTYVSRTTRRFTTPERALEELLAWREQGDRRMPWWRKGLRVVLRILKING